MESKTNRPGCGKSRRHFIKSAGLILGSAALQGKDLLPSRLINTTEIRLIRKIIHPPDRISSIFMSIPV